jgi:hypothetical protein
MTVALPARAWTRFIRAAFQSITLGRTMDRRGQP